MTTRSTSFRRIGVLTGVAALAAAGCATGQASERRARIETPQLSAQPAAAPTTIYIDVQRAPAQPAAAPSAAPGRQAADAELTRVIEAPAPTVAVQVPRARVMVEPQPPRILIDQQPPEVVVGQMPQPQIYLRRGADGVTPGQERPGAGAAMPGAMPAQEEMTKVIQAPGPTITVDVPRPRVVVQPQPARVIVNQQPPEVVLEPMPPPQISAGQGRAPAASPRIDGDAERPQPR